MDLIEQAITYLQTHPNEFGRALTEHLQLSFVAILIAAFVCVPLGILTSRYGTFARIIINVVGLGRVFPSLAVLLVLLPIVGVGFTPALIALVLLAFPPILINTDAGLRALDAATLEAARGMGMSRWQSLLKVELPLALPVIIGGLRTAMVEVIASAALATLIGAGGFGDIITQGLSGNDNAVVLAGAIPVAVLALIAEVTLAGIQRAAMPGRSLRLRVAWLGRFFFF